MGIGEIIALVVCGLCFGAIALLFAGLGWISSHGDSTHDHDDSTRT